MIKNNPPESFKSGVNVLMLIDRGVQNSNKGSKRWINKIITTNQEEWEVAANRLLELQWHVNEPSIRLYASINPRKMDKAILLFKHKQLDLQVNGHEHEFYRRINDNFCSALMQQECRNSNLFLLDYDSKDTKAIDSFLITNFGIKVHFQYPTVKGWHYIVDPFNPEMCSHLPDLELKKDGLILLNWIYE